MTQNLESLQILAMVAEEYRLADLLNLDSLPIKSGSAPKTRVSAVSQHGSAWSYQDNAVLWKAYEDWEAEPQLEEIIQWKRNPHLIDRSFPYYAFKKHFTKRRTLISVKKHFFKLKQSQFGKNQSANTMKITIPKRVWQKSMEQEFQDSDDSEESGEERTFLKISSNALHRRKKQCFDTEKSCSKEVEFRNIVDMARQAANYVTD